MTHIAFTGTQVGMTPVQLAVFGDVYLSLAPEWFHHGDCVGADEQAHNAAQILGYGRVSIHVHPCDLYGKRAWRNGHIVDLPMPPLDRNRVMVDACAALIACPKRMVEELRSGTWATIRYARKARKPVHIVWPDGSYVPPPPS